MTTLREILANDPLSVADAVLKKLEGQECFAKYLPASVPEMWLRVLSIFTRTAPLNYWSPQVLDEALSILEADKARTLAALSEWRNRIGIGYDSLLRPAPTNVYEESHEASAAKDLLRLANEFHPEYLRRCEHIFSNLIVLYWAILKRKGVGGKFDLTGAVARIQSTQHEVLLSGYDEKIRNAIAHGEVVFRGMDICYGVEAANHEMLPFEFLDRFDEIWRTSNSLAIAVILFLARYQEQMNAGIPATLTLPVGIINLIAKSEAERTGLTVLGLVESNLPGGAKQLHIAVKTIFLGRSAVLLDCSRISLHLLKSGASGYKRFLFDIDHGAKRTSMGIILPEQLAELTNSNAGFDRINEIFEENQLLWYDESMFAMRLKALQLSLVSNFRLAWKKYIAEIQTKGLFAATARYRIKKITNASAGGVARIKAFVVLRRHFDAQDRTLVREIAHTVVSRLSRRLIETNPSDIVKRMNWLGWPKYVWVNIYQYDGPIRWLETGGWPKGNLVATAEKINGAHYKSIYVKNPEETWKGIRFRYSMDMAEAARATVEVLEVANKISTQNSRDKPLEQ